MANMLPDGTIVPSYFSSEPMGARSSPNSFGNMVLRQGEIREIIWPDDPRSASKVVVEYNVAVQVRDGNGPAAVVNYPNCQVANLFGGTADKFRFTLRPQTKDPEKGKVTADGSKVQILCVNGEVRRAFIVSGVNEDKTPEKKDDGHNLKFSFNGVKVGINKDGELRVEYNGATKADGTLESGADADASGSSIVFQKDGSVKVFTAAGDQFIHLDHKNKKIDIHANKEWNVTSDDTIDLTATGQMTLTAKTCSIDMDDRAFIRTAGLYVGTASDATLLGETFRRNQGQMHTTMSSTLDSLGGLISTAATNLQVAATLLKIPVAGPALSSVPLQLAATALNGAGPMFNALSAAIKTFEAGNYLSTKNKSD